MSCISLLLLLTVAAQAHARLPKDAPEHGPDPCLQEPAHAWPEDVVGYFPDYYYDNNDNRCYRFAFNKGIVGNDNRFDSEEECEKRCKITNDRCLQPESPKSPGCSQEGASHPRLPYPQYYFNKSTRKCELVAPCSGKQAIFFSKRHCQVQCLY